MSALPGDAAPKAFVFPPFMPPAPRSAPAATPSGPAEAAPDDFTMGFPLPAHDPGVPDGERGFDAEEAGSQQWEAAAPPAAEDFPWLEMPAEGPRVHSAEPSFDDDEMAGWDARDVRPAAGERAPWTETTVADEAMPWAESPASEEAALWAETPVPVETARGAETTAPHDVAPWAETPSAGDAGPWGDSPAPGASGEPSWPPFIAEAEEAPPAQALFAHDAPAVEESASAPAYGAEAADTAFEDAPATSLIAASDAAGYGEVADRLEAIARALRDGPGSFLAGGSGDALGLLVTGFVLGYGHGRRERGA